MAERLFGHYTMQGGVCRACETAGRTATHRAGRNGERWGMIIKRSLVGDEGGVLGEVCLVCDVFPPALHRTGGRP